MTNNKKPVAPWIAGLVPLFVIVAAQLVLLVVAQGPNGLVRMVRESGGVAIALIVLATLSGTVMTGVLLALSGLGKRVPPALILFVASLPWLVGMAGMMLDLVRMFSAVAVVDPAMKLMLLMKGMAEASGARIIGAVEGGALLGGTALGLSIAAVGLRDREGRSSSGAAIGGLASIPLWIAAFVAASEGGKVALIPVFVAAVALSLSGVLAGLAAGDAAPEGRSRVLAAPALVAGALAIAASVVVSLEAMRAVVYDAVVSVAPDMLGTIAGAATRDIWPIDQLGRYAGGIALFPAIGVAIFAQVRGPAGGGKALVTAGAALFVAVLVAGADFAVGHAAAARAVAFGALPWEDRPGFQPMAIAGEALDGEIDAIVTRSDLANPAPLIQRIQAKVRPVLRLAVDASLAAGELRPVLQAGAAAGAGSLEIVGEGPGFAEEEGEERIRSSVPLLHAAVRRPTFRRVLLRESVQDRCGLSASMLDARTIAVSWRTRSADEKPLLVSLEREDGPNALHEALLEKLGTELLAECPVLEIRADPSTKVSAIAEAAAAIERAQLEPALSELR